MDYKVTPPEGSDSFECPESSNIYRAFYIKSDKTLVISFKDSKDSDHPKSAYEYHDVPEDIWNQFKSAPSKGQFARKAIVINPKYSGVKLWAI